MKRIVLFLLLIYKKYISKGYNCRFVPNCSEYSYLAVEKHGVVKGLLKSGWRILRCNPLSKGGVDFP